MIEVMRRDVWVPDPIRDWKPRTELGFSVLRALRYLPEDLARELVERISRSVIGESNLALKVIRPYRGSTKVEDLGIVSRRVVTDTGVGFQVDAFQNLVEVELMKFHGIGTGGTAEAASQTALVTELTTQYNPDSTRATGTTTESAANAYQTVGTNAVDSAVAVTEHGIFSAVTAGVLLDRSLFAVVNLASGESLQSTYTYTLTSGG